MLMVCPICEEMIFDNDTNKDLIPVCPKCKEKIKKWEEMKKDKIMRRTNNERSKD